MSIAVRPGYTPLRQPDTSSPRVMTRRAWLLVILNFLIPGTAQSLAGSRRLGRFGLRATFTLWTFVVLAGILWWLAPVAAYSVGTNSWVLLLAQIALVFYAVLWIILTFDTLRIVRLVKATPAGRTLVAAFSVLLMVATCGTFAYGAVLAGSARGALGDIFSGGNFAEPIDGQYNILLLGGDAGADRLGLRPDSISVVSIDAETGETVIVGVPRNMQRVPFAEGSPLYGPFPSGYDCGNDCLVSYLYTYGEENPDLYPEALVNDSEPGIEAMRDAVEGVTGLEMQYYVLIDMQGFSKLIDALGGIDITVEDRLPIEGGEDSNGQPINVDGWIEPGAQHMNGYTALWYARARHGSSDYDRMGRQRDVQEAILTQFDAPTVLSKFQSIASVGSEIVRTDIPESMLGRFVDLAGKAQATGLERLELVPPEYDMIHPDFAGIQATVESAVNPPTPTDDGN